MFTIIIEVYLFMCSAKGGTWTCGISSEDLHLKGPTLYQLRHLPATKHAQLQRVETTVIENEDMYL